MSTMDATSAPQKTTIPLWRQLRWTLALYFVLLVAVSMAIVAAIVVSYTTAQATSQVTAQLESVAELKTTQIKTWLNNIQSTLTLAATGPRATRMLTFLTTPPNDAGYSAQVDEHVSLFRELSQSQPFFESFFLYTPEGQIVAASERADMGKIVTAQPYYRRSLVNDHIQPPYYALGADRLIIVATHPVVNKDGKVAGVLAARVNLGPLSEIMNQRAGLGKTGETYLVSAESNYLLTSSRFEQEGYIATRAYHSAGIDRALAGQNGAGAYADYRGQQVLGVYRWVPELECALLAEQNISEALAGAYGTRNLILLVAVIGVVVAGVAGGYVATRLSAPILALTGAAARIAGGDLSARVKIAVGNEIGLLAHTFNTMVEQVGSLLTTVQERRAELEERTRELEASQRVTFAASEHIHPDELLDLVVNLIRDQFDLYHVQVYIVDEQQNAAVLRRSTGYAGRQLLQKGHHIPLDRPSLVTTAINTGQPVLVDDVAKTPDFMPNPLLPETRSELVMPLKVGDRIIGALDAQDRSPGRFSKSTIALFQSMTDQVAFLFENSALIEQVNERTRALTLFTNQLRTAADIARRLGAVLDPNQLLDQLVGLLQSRFGLYHAHIYLLDEKTNQLTVRAGSGEVGKVLRERRHSIALEAEKSIVARAARERQAIVVDDTALVSDFMPNPLLPQTRSELAVPLVFGDQVIGVLDVQDDQAHRFTQADVDTFGTLAGQIATALQNAQLFEAQKRSEAQARANEIRFRTLFEGVHDAVFTLSGDRFIDFNPKTLELFGVTAEQFLNESPARFSPPFQPDGRSSQEASLEKINAALAGQPQFFEWQHIRGDGTPFDAEVALRRYEYGGQILVQATVRDITERKRAEQAIKQQEERFRTVADFTYDWEYWLGADGRYVYVSPSCERVSGYTVDDFMRDPGLFEAITHPDDRRIVDEHLRQYHGQHGEEVGEAEFRIVTRDGQERWIGHVCQAVYNAQGDWAGRRASNRDITEQKQAELQVQKRAADLKTVAQVSTIASTILDPDRLLQTVVDLVKANFGLYHAHIYLLDEAGETLQLAAGAGEAGAAMKAQGWQIPLARERSLVAQAARSRQGVIINDVRAEPDFMPNPLLPDTRSELAVPIIAGDKMLGVLDVQADQVGRFTQEDVFIQTTLAGQIAIALQNAQLFEQARTERALTDSILSNMPIGVMAVDQNFGVLRVNQAAQQMLGRQVTDREGNVYVEQYDVIHYDTGQRYDESALPLVKAVTLGGQHSASDAAIRKPDGTVVPLLINAGPLLDPAGRQMGGVVIFADTTEQRKAEQAVREQRDRAQLYLDMAGAIIVALDTQGNITLINNRGCQILGYEESELVGQNWFDVTVPQAIRDMVKGVFAQLMAGEIEATEYYENEITTRSGELRTVAWHNSLLKDEAGNIIGSLSSGEDITERKQAEQAMKQQEEKFRTVADFTYDWEYWLGVDGNYVYVSPACERITGYSVSEFMQAPSLFESIAHPKDKAALDEHIRKYHGQHGEEVGEAEFRIVTRDGQERWIGHVCQAVYNAQGDWAGRRASNRDITEQKQAELQVQKRAADLKTVAEVSAIASTILDPDRLLQTVVDLVKASFGLYHAHVYLLDEAGETLQLAAGAGEAGAAMKAQGWQIPLTREKSLVAQAARSRQGLTVNDVRAEPDFMPNPLLPDTRSELAVPIIAGDKMVGVLDVQADQVGRFTPEDVSIQTTLAGQIAIAFQNADLFDLNQARLRASQALIGAQTEEDALDAIIKAADFYPEAMVSILTFEAGDDPALVARRAQVLASGLIPLSQPGQRFPASQFGLIRYITPDQPLISANLQTDERVDAASRALAQLMGATAVAILPLTAGGEWLGILAAMSRQVGYFDRRKLYLYQSLAEQGAIALRTARLYDETQKVAERLREVDRLKSEFLANMSHELRTPLNSIIGYAELMLMNLSGQLDERTLNDAQAIMDNGQHLLHMINDILDMAKIEAGRLTLNLDEVEVAPLLEELATTSAGLLVNKPIELSLEIADGLPAITADRVRLTQIVNNLLSNAIKFTEQGRVTLRAYQHNEHVCIEVQDTGVGIAEQNLGLIFERFRQVDGSDARRAEGTGLGLSITNHLVRMHGGTISVQSKLGEGSTFTVRLPIQRAAEQEREGEQ